MLTALALAATVAAEPYPADYDRIVRKFLAEALRDPDAAKIETARPPRWGVFKRPFKPGTTGWIVCYRVNGKNAYGGYTGFQDFLFVLSGGAPLAYTVSPTFNRYAGKMMDDELVTDECALPADTPPT